MFVGIRGSQIQEDDRWAVGTAVRISGHVPRHDPNRGLPVCVCVCVCISLAGSPLLLPSLPTGDIAIEKGVTVGRGPG